jgi:hypothetical protein
MNWDQKAATQAIEAQTTQGGQLGWLKDDMDESERSGIQTEALLKKPFDVAGVEDCCDFVENR